MKALTVQQPWAWAIVHGGKDVENRTQAWRYRGPLAIHAGARVSERGLRTVPSIVAAERGTSPTLVADQVRSSIELGAIIGVVDLVDVHAAAGERIEGPLRTPQCCESWWAELSYAEHGGKTRRDIVHLVLENPQPLDEPIPCRGALGLWTPPIEVLEQLGV